MSYGHQLAQADLSPSAARGRTADAQEPFAKPREPTQDASFGVLAPSGGLAILAAPEPACSVMHLPNPAAARERGRSEARELDLRLRREELREREELMANLLLQNGSADAVRTAPAPALGQVERLAREIAMLAEYQRAVLRSKPWKLAQLARRLLGRPLW
jgi:hypothetical protein